RSPSAARLPTPVHLAVRRPREWPSPAKPAFRTRRSRVTLDSHGRGTCHMTFKVGDTVVYPHHGAATIEAIETRQIKGEDKTYLVLKLAQGDLEVRLPAENAELVGVRDVVSQDGLDRVFEVLRAPYAEEPTNWSRRYK